MKKIAMLLLAVGMSFGLTGCLDDLFSESTTCELIYNCSNSTGYSCDAEPNDCWGTRAECQASANCN